MELKDFLKRSNLLFTRVTTRINSASFQHRFNLINENKINVIWNEVGESDYPTIKIIEELNDTSSLSLEIEIKNIPGVMNSIITLLEMYLKDINKHIEFNKDRRNIILTIEIPDGDLLEKYNNIIKELSEHQLSQVANRLRNYLMKNNLYTNEILNSPYTESHTDTFSMYLKNDGYIIDNEHTEKLNKLLDDITEITPSFVFENTVSQIKDHIFIKFYLDSGLDSEDFEYPLLADLFILNELKKSKYERVPLFRFNDTIVHDRTGFNLDVYEIPINYEYLSIRTNTTIRVNKDDENSFSFIPYEFKPLLKEYLNRMKEYLKYTNKIYQIGTLYDADEDIIYLCITVNNDFEELKKEIS